MHLFIVLSKCTLFVHNCENELFLTKFDFFSRKICSDFIRFAEMRWKMMKIWFFFSFDRNYFFSVFQKFSHNKNNSLILHNRFFMKFSFHIRSFLFLFGRFSVFFRQLLSKIFKFHNYFSSSARLTAANHSQIHSILNNLFQCLKSKTAFLFENSMISIENEIGIHFDHHRNKRSENIQRSFKFESIEKILKINSN